MKNDYVILAAVFLLLYLVWPRKLSAAVSQAVSGSTATSTTSTGRTEQETSSVGASKVISTPVPVKGGVGTSSPVNLFDLISRGLGKAKLTKQQQRAADFELNRYRKTVNNYV